MRKTFYFILFSFVFTFAETASSAERPNIIFLLADDLGYGDLGCYGQKLIKTPNLDRLASEGIRFTQAYAGGPVCTPSRSVFLTGLHAGHTPARDNVPHYPTYFDEDDLTIAEVLKDAGYRTGGIGKWSMGDPGTPGRATNQGFDMWYGYLNQDHAHYYYTDYLDRNEGRHELPNNAISRDRYSHDLLTKEAIKFIRESKDKPFFFYGAYTLPHFSSKHEDPHGLTVPTTDPYTDKEWDLKSKKYASMVHMLDRDVGRIMNELEGLGIAENTLLIFSSDNGGHSTVWDEFDTNGPLRGYKRDLYEGGVRVPFIARWPGEIPEGKVSEEVIAFQDLFPTFAEMAGAEVSGVIDGISVLEALKGEEVQARRDFLYWDYGHCRRFYDQAVRLEDWKGIRLGKEKGKIQLYDLATDVGEETDVSTEHPDVVAKIESIMDNAVTPNPRYPIGKVYKGGAIWLAENYHASESKVPDLAEPGQGSYESAEFIFDPDDRPTPTCHSSSIVETPSGLVATWFGGTSEPDIDNVIWVSRKVSGNWTKPLQVVDGTEGEERDHRVGNPVLFQPVDGPLMLFYKVVNPEVGRASHWWGMLTTSEDGGKTWSAPWKLGESSKLGEGNPHLLGPVKNKPIQLADGTIYCPSSTEHDGWRVHFELTKDFGKTWEVIGPINDASNFNVIQPSVLTYPDGRMQILCRTKESIIAQSWSEDGGHTWGEITATHLPNPNSGTDAVTLKDGRQLLVYNHTVRKAPFPNNRGMLNVAISSDGKKWDPILTLEKEEGKEFSYPAVIQTSDGKVHITYTWKRETIRHVILNPEKIH